MQLNVAGIGSRFLAIAIDSLIQLVLPIVCALLLPLVWNLRDSIGPRATLWTGAALLASLFLLHFGYFAFFEIRWNGQTPGKRKVGIRVVKDDGRPLSPAECIARNLLRIVDELPGLYAVGVLVALLNRRGKRLGDIVAGSLVVRETRLEDLKPVLPGAPEHAGMPLLGAHHLAPADLALVDSYLGRSNQLPPDVRWTMADRILAGLRPKLNLSDEAWSAAVGGRTPEAVLAALAYEYRSRGGA